MNENMINDWDDEYEMEEYDPEGELDIMFPDGIDDGTSLDTLFCD